MSIQVQFHAEAHVRLTVPPKSPRKTSSMQSKNKLNARPIMSHHSLFLLLKILLLLDKQVSHQIYLHPWSHPCPQSPDHSFILDCGSTNWESFGFTVLPDEYQDHLDQLREEARERFELLINSPLVVADLASALNQLSVEHQSIQANGEESLEVRYFPTTSNPCFTLYF